MTYDKKLSILVLLVSAKNKLGKALQRRQIHVAAFVECETTSS